MSNCPMDQDFDIRAYQNLDHSYRIYTAKHLYQIKKKKIHLILKLSII